MSQTPGKLKKNTSKCSLRQHMRNLLKKCEINPTAKGPWQAIAEVSGAEYLEVRALEEVQRAIRSLKTPHAPGMLEYKSYEQHMVQATELLTLARLKRQTYLLDEDKYHVVIVTQMGLQEGSSEAHVEQRRMVACKATGEKYVPLRQTEETKDGTTQHQEA